MTDEINDEKLNKSKPSPFSFTKGKKAKRKSVDVSRYEEVNVKITDGDGNRKPAPYVRQDREREEVEKLKKLGGRKPKAGKIRRKSANGHEPAKAPERPADAIRMLLDQFSDADIVDYLVKRAEINPALRDVLSAKFNMPASPETPPDLVPTLTLPEKAPKTWANRSKGTNAAQFLRETYAPWIEAGVLTRTALKAFDKALYQTYHVWVHRHPEDAVPLKDTPQPHFIADPADAIERRRASIRASKAKARLRKRDSMSQVSLIP